MVSQSENTDGTESHRYVQSQSTILSTCTRPRLSELVWSPSRIRDCAFAPDALDLASEMNPWSLEFGVHPVRSLQMWKVKFLVCVHYLIHTSANSVPPDTWSASTTDPFESTQA